VKHLLAIALTIALAAALTMGSTGCKKDATGATPSGTPTPVGASTPR